MVVISEVIGQEDQVKIIFKDALKSTSKLWQENMILILPNLSKLLGKLFYQKVALSKHDKFLQRLTNQPYLVQNRLCHCK